MSGRARPDEPLADWCEARLEDCYGRAAHRHHRKLRKQGGTDDAVNTRDICGSCHKYIHLNPRWSYATGWLVASWADPAEIETGREADLFGLGADWGDR
jgi:hypothetical protein